MYDIVKFIKDGHRTIAYIMIDENNVRFTASRAETLTLINMGLINNAKVTPYINQREKRFNRITVTESKRAKEYVNYSYGLSETYYGADMIKALDNMQIGNPIIIHHWKLCKREQVLYAGVQEVQGKKAYVFFNGATGATGTYALTKEFIMQDSAVGEGISIIIGDNNPNKVMQLRKQIGQYS